MKTSQLDRLVKSGIRPEGMSYGQYADALRKSGIKPLPQAAFEKSEAMRMETGMRSQMQTGSNTAMEKGDDDDDDDDDDDEEGEEMGKSIDLADLQKSIDRFEAAQATSTYADTDRLTYLQARYDAGTILKSERQELAKLIAGDDEPRGGTSLSKSLTDRMDEVDPESSNLVRANDFLKSLVECVDDALSSVSDGVGRESHATRELLRAQGDMVKSLAGVVGRMGGLLDEMQHRLNGVETQPVPQRSVRSVNGSQVTARPLMKGALGGDRIGGQGSGGDSDKLSKGQVLAGLDKLVKSAIERNDDGAIKRLTHAVAKFESTNQIHPDHYAAAATALQG